MHFKVCGMSYILSNNGMSYILSNDNLQQVINYLPVWWNVDKNSRPPQQKPGRHPDQ